MFSNLILKKCWQLFSMREKVSKNVISEKTDKNIVMQDDENIFERLKGMQIKLFVFIGLKSNRGNGIAGGSEKQKILKIRRCVGMGVTVGFNKVILG